MYGTYRSRSIVHKMDLLAEQLARRSSRWLVLLTLTFALIAPGCATPIGVRYVEPRVAYHSLTANVLSAERPSSFSARELMNLNQYERFNEEPEKALAEMHAGLAAKGDEDRVFALAELSFAYAHDSGERSHYLASAVYAYAFLFPGKDGTRPNGLDPRFRWAADIYNQALTRAAMLDDREYPVPRGGTFNLPFGEITVQFDQNQLLWAGFRLKDFVPAADVEVRGLRNRYRIPGVGAPLSAKIEPIEGVASKQSARIPPRMRIPATAFLRLDDPRGALKSGKLKGKLEFYTPDSARSLKIEGVDVPIEYETTSALALTLEGAPIWDFEIAGFRSGDFTLSVPGALREGLFMIRPHRTGRIPVVLVHGTASSPARWAELVNELENDPRFLENYEIWLFMYNTGNPIADSAARMRAALLNIVADLDPEKKDPGLQQMVMIGHSQGGILTKLMAIRSGNRFWENITKEPFEDVKTAPETLELLREAMFFEPVPTLRRVVFIATPHRGSYQASGWALGLIRRFITLPGTLVSQFQGLAQAQTFGLGIRELPTSVENMSPGHQFLRALNELPIDPGITAHSIIAVRGDGPVTGKSDGLVAYESAHIEGVASELVVRSDHSTQGHPDTVEEVRRILREH